MPNAYTDNAAGIALYRKFGFVIEGTHRAFAYRSGQYVGAHSMAWFCLTTRNSTEDSPQ